MKYPTAPLRQIGDVFLGKMLQPDPKSPEDVLAPYLRAAHIQPDGRLVEVEEKRMWFAPEELGSHSLDTGDVVVVPFASEARWDGSKAKHGNEIPFIRIFYVPEEPRPLTAIDADVQRIMGELAKMFQGVKE